MLLEYVKLYNSWVFSLQFIPGFMVGIEFPGKDDIPDFDGIIPSWGVVIDLGIIRVVFLKLDEPKEV